MSRLHVCAVIFALCVFCGSAWARSEPLFSTSSWGGSPLSTDLPVPNPVRSDTLNFGFYDPGTGYAVLGERWTWDHGASDPFEGWTSVDQTAQDAPGFRQISASGWAGHGNEAPVPLLTGEGSLWIGAFEDEADSYCWNAGLGYGNHACQGITSPTLEYAGSGGITLALRYFADSEPNYDYTRISLLKGGEEIPVNGSVPGAGGFTGRIHVECTGDVCVLNIPASPWTATVPAAVMGEPGPFTVRIAFESDGGWSDEDGEYSTYFGPFGADDVAVTGGAAAAYNFDASLQGWTPAACPAIGSYFAVHPLSMYDIPDPCSCELTGNVLSLHDANLGHPVGQRESASSNIVDHTAYMAYNEIFADFDLYADLPQSNGVLYRPAWDYYPYLCEATGEITWSGPVSQDTWFFTGGLPDCVPTRSVATDWAIPADAQYLKYVFEVYADCEAFGIPPTQCTGETNFSPLFDNVRVRMTRVPNAPPTLFQVGGRFADGFPQGYSADYTDDPGNADIVRDLHMQNEALPDKLGDSLVIAGPSPTPAGGGRWEARLYLRVRREGPAQRTIPRYNTWLARVSDGLSIVGADAPFTFGWMDSVETALIRTNQFCSQFRENDDDFIAPEQGEDNEILWDNMLTPGSKIEYFVASNFICTPAEQYLMPDTAGRFYLELEMLPSYRMSDGVAKRPCLLYVDAAGAGVQPRIENALNMVLEGLPSGTPVPDPARWDRYDYQDAPSSWVAGLFRWPGGNSGATMPQLIGYRMILVNTGDYGPGAMEPSDWSGLGDWLRYMNCGANQALQGLILNGDNMGEILQQDGPGFLADLGARFICGSYNAPVCPPGDPDNDLNPCVRLEQAAGGPWAPDPAMDLYGNGCPALLSYDVLGSDGDGVGNKVFSKIGGGVTEYAQITNSQRAPFYADNYRTVLDGFSYDHLTRRDLSNPGPISECLADEGTIAEAAAGEIRNALRWTLNLADPLTLGLCGNPCGLVTPGVDETPAGGNVNRLDQNQPNPFNPRTVIRYSLAARGPARITVFDVGGRRLRTLFSGVQEAGPHEVVWDGTDDTGHPVGSGVFWSQLTAGDYASQKKMVVLK